MSLIELQAWLPDSDLSGAPDHTFASDDQLVDAGFNPVLWGEGDGFMEIHADDPDAQYLQRRGFIRAVRTDTGEGLFWWILEEGSVKLLSNSGKVGRVIRWDGRGMLYYLDRYKLGQAVWAPGQPFRGSVNVFDYWTWVDQPMIAILTRFMEEGQNDTRAEFLNKLDYDFSRVVDSNGNSLTALEEYQVRIGTGGLTLAADAMRQGNLLQVLPQSPPLLQAFRDVAEYRTDRSSATYASDKVRFAAAQNIATELPHKIVALRERTHTLTRRKDGQYATEDVDGSGVPYMEFLDVPFTSDPVAVEEVVSQAHLARQAQSTVAVIRHKLGPGGASGAQGYFPSPAGHYWVGDLVTAHSGTGEYDLNEQALEVAGIRYFLRGADWMVEAQLGAQVINAAGAPVSVPNAGPTVPRSPDLRICRDPIEGEAGESLFTRLYFTDHAAGSGEGSGSASAPSSVPFDAGWDNTSSINRLMLNEVPQDSVNGQTDRSTGGGGDDTLLTQFLFPVDAALATLLAAGGAQIRMQARAHARSGIGIDESAQDVISQLSIRVTQGATATIRGTALAMHSLASSAGSTKWAAQSTLVNRVFPAVAADDALSAVPGATAGDYLVVEVGYRNFTVGSTGGGVHYLDSSTAGDLPENESSSSNLNSWLDLVEITATASYPGSLPEPTVLPGEETNGDCTDVASCCHTHAHGELGAEDDYAGNALHDVTSQLSTTETDTALVLKPDGAGGVEWGADATGGGGGGGGTGVRVTRNAALNVTTSLVAIAWDNEVTDDAAFWASSPNPERLTAPADGWYMVGGALETTNASPDWLQGLLRLDGTTSLQFDIYFQTTTTPKALAFHQLIYLTAGQYLEILAMAQATQALVPGASCNFWMFQLGGDPGGGGGNPVVYDRERYVAGDIAVNDTAVGSSTDIGVVPDLVVPAAVGDVLMIGISCRTEGAPSPSLRMDVKFLTGATENFVSSQGTTASGQGISGWFLESGGAHANGEVMYIVQAADIAGGNVTLQLCAWVTTGSHTVAADADAPLLWWVRNLGQ